MANLNEVIRGLECCMLSYKHGCDECPYVAKGMCQELLGEHALALLKAQEPITGETSDGYHTFNELYHHRAVLFSVIVANYPDRAWKAKKHHDGTMYDNMFIVGIDTPDGQATYHYDIDPYWDMFKCRVLDNAPEWDGHTPAQAIERIGKLKAQEPNPMPGAELTDVELMERIRKAPIAQKPVVDMSDLISREAAKAAIRSKFQSVAERCEINEVLNGLPAVDAVPWWWLENMMLEREAEESRAAWLVMREWQKEREAK
jgi:hypothetical protein